ncbi:hypothetical protein L1278_000687 [Pontibacter sp. HSC-36F09]|nr:hypothetical protein [Pontibacter sp. HSC-36F09]
MLSAPLYQLPAVFIYRNHNGKGRKKRREIYEKLFQLLFQSCFF